jgi:hypothetical protein
VSPQTTHYFTVASFVSPQTTNYFTATSFVSSQTINNFALFNTPWSGTHKPPIISQWLRLFPHKPPIISQRLRLCPHKPPIISQRLRLCPHKPPIILHAVVCACLPAVRSSQTTNHPRRFPLCLYQPPKYSTNDICKTAVEVGEDNSNIVASSMIAGGEDTHRGSVLLS